MLLAQLGLPKPVLNDKSLANTNKAVNTGLALISVTWLSQRVAGSTSTYQTAAHDGIRVLLGLLRHVARHALVGLQLKNGLIEPPNLKVKEKQHYNKTSVSKPQNHVQTTTPCAILPATRRAARPSQTTAASRACTSRPSSSAENQSCSVVTSKQKNS